MNTTTRPAHSIHGTTITIQGNEIFEIYSVVGNKVYKHVQEGGDEFRSEFHTMGALPLNTESVLLNTLREEGKI